MITIEDIDNEAGKVNTSATEKQKEAGNYSKGHISVKGMKIAIENPKGSKRYYDGGKKYNVMNNHYGYFNITKGKDGDAVDVFLGPDIEDFDKVYCVDQNNGKGEFDETKVMLGFSSKEEAKDAYMSNYSPDWKGFRGITSVSIKDFKKWLYRGRKQRQPFADYVYIQKKKLDESTILNEKNGVIDEKFLAIADWMVKRYKTGVKRNRWGERTFTIPSNVFSKYNVYGLPFKNLRVEVVDRDTNNSVQGIGDWRVLKLQDSVLRNGDLSTIAHELIHIIQQKDSKAGDKMNTVGHWTLPKESKETAHNIAYDFDPQELSARISEAGVYFREYSSDNDIYSKNGLKHIYGEGMDFNKFYTFVLKYTPMVSYNFQSLNSLLRLYNMEADLNKIRKDTARDFISDMDYAIQRFRNQKPMSFTPGSAVFGLLMSRPWYLKKIIPDYKMLFGEGKKKWENGNWASVYDSPGGKKATMWFVVLKGELLNYFESTLESYKQKIAKTLAPAIKDVYDEIINMNNKNNMKHTIKLNESDITNAIKNAAKKVIKEAYTTNDIADTMGMYDGYDGPTNDGPDFDEVVYYKARKIMRKYGYDSTEGFVRDKKVDALEYVMDTYMDYYANDKKLREMDADEVAKLMAVEAMKIIDNDYYEEEVKPLMEAKKVVKINEKQIKDIIKNCVKRVLKENYEPTQADWDDFGEWASSDEPDLWQDEMSAEHDKAQQDDGILIDTDDEGDGYSRDYLQGVEYAKNLIAKSKVPEGMVEELNQKENNGTISAYELGILDTLDEG